MKRLIGRLLGGGAASEPELVVPAVLETGLLGTTARFDALVPEDYGRILRFDGERAFYEEILAAVRPGDCYWDIGSFIGLCAVLAAKKCPAARVLAVEPDPEFCQRIRNNIALNALNNVELLELGLSDSRGTLPLNTSGGTGWAPSFFDKGLKHHVEVPISTLDLICAERPELAPDLVKIDVEGFEAHVIRGASSLLASDKLRTIFIELHPVPLRDNGEQIGALLANIENHGFRFRSFQGRKNEILAIAER